MSGAAIKTIQETLTVKYDYPVVFLRGLFAPTNSCLAETVDRLREKRRHRVSVFIDAGVVKQRRDVLKTIELYFKAHTKTIELTAKPRVVPGGEGIKGDGMLLLSLVNDMIAQHLSRQCVVLVIGGGAVLDAVGFAASLIHRGLRVVRAPTTALSQCDSGVGVKTAVNMNGGKNIVGTFAPPFAVLNDFDFLATLPDGEWAAGIAEAFKVAIIKDADFLRRLCAQAGALKARQMKALEEVLIRCAELHLYHIRTSGDPFEMGAARPLDFGHWAAHKLESMSNYKIGHGQAVAAGVALDSIYAARKGWLAADELELVLKGMKDAGLTLWYDEFNRKDRSGNPMILAGLKDFQEHLGGELCVTFPKRLGYRHEVHEVEAATVKKALAALKEL